MRAIRPAGVRPRTPTALRAGSSQREERYLKRLAERCGIETSYREMSGKICHVPLETLKAILEIRGCAQISPTSPGNTNELIEKAEPVDVAWDGVLKTLPINHCCVRPQSRCHILIIQEGGGEKRLDCTINKISHALRRVGRLPYGYHRLHLEVDGVSAESLLISAPRRSYQNPTNRLQKLGLFAPLYALRSEQSWGAGNFSDLKTLSGWASGQGMSVLATLPLLACFVKAGGDPSPYNPISRLFWNEFYIDVGALPELARSPKAAKKVRSRDFQAALAKLRKGDWVDYAQGMKLRREILSALASQVDSAALDNFVRARPEAVQYARFRTVYDKLRIPWQRWPESLRAGHLNVGDYSEEDERFYLYAQFAAQRQMDQLAANCSEKQVQLYLDLPVGVNRNGFDVWRQKDLFASKASVGAPPDMFFNQGQNWGFPPMIPERMRQTGYAHIIDYLRFQMRHAGVLRIDHVMGLHRLYWIPPGFSAKEGAYVRYPAEELHAIVCLESHRNRCEIVGENLGIVPDAVNHAMDEHRYRKMYIVQFEQRPKQPALGDPPSGSVASLETHDTPAFTAHWLGEDISFRVKLGQLKREQAPSEYARRRKLNAETQRFLIAQHLLHGPHAEPTVIMRALVHWLRKTKAGIILLSLESFWGEKRPQNVPGTMQEYRNWSRKMALSLEDLLTTSPVPEDIRTRAEPSGRS